MENKSEVAAQSHVISYTVDSFDNGIAFGQHKLDAEDDPRRFYQLKLIPEGEVLKLRSRYALKKENPLWELERYLARLARQGTLASASVYLGTSCDPFFPFEGKFDASMRFLELFTRYQPGMLVVQTRSPLVVLAVPVLKKLKERAAVTIALETPDESAVVRYTPNYPRVKERLRAALSLRRLGVEVTIQIAPVLPYGDWKGDAVAFAKILSEHADYVVVGALNDGSEAAERRLRNSSLGSRLSMDKRYHWLRPDAAKPLEIALEKICPEKLMAPKRPQLKQKQLGIFAA